MKNSHTIKNCVVGENFGKCLMIIIETGETMMIPFSEILEIHDDTGIIVVTEKIARLKGLI